ncbi:polyadenylate-binding protein-interacting protein 2 [Ciona intestinalis]
MKGPPETLKEGEAGGAVVELRTAEIHAVVEPSPVNNEPMNAQDLLEQYSWMAEAEEFDQQVLEQIKQEDYIEQCFEDMWNEEARVVGHNPIDSDTDGTAIENACNGSLEDSVTSLSIRDNQPQLEEHLNPNAVSFVPRCDSDS